MSFNSNIPQPTDLISVSQQDLLNNFSSIQTTYNTDHYGFNPATNLGFHKHVTMGNDPGNVPMPASGFGSAYATTVNSQTYPLWRRDGLTTDFPMMPIKAYAYFVGSNPATSNFTLPYANVNSITRMVIGGLVGYRVNFVNPFPNTNYGAIGSVFGPTTLFMSFKVFDASNMDVFFVGAAGVVPDPGNSMMVTFIN